MANELAIRQDGIGGLVEDNPLTSSATTLTSAALAAMNAVTSTSFMWVILDPDGVDGAPEHIKVTAHTAGATTATVLRGQGGTTARQHAKDTPWLHGPVAADFSPVVARQGGSATDWNSGGATNYFPAKTLMQTGRRNSGSIAAGGFESITVTFPIPFLNPPLVLCSGGVPTGHDIWSIRVDATTTTTCTLLIVSNATSGSGTKQAVWLAIGEVA